MPPEIAAVVSAQTFFFLILALGALGSAIAMVLHPNPVRAALFLVINLFCVAGLYLLLNAYFLAAVQVIVYAGAIMVLFLFVIMLLNLGSPDRTVDELRWQQPFAVIAGIVLALVIGGTIYSSIAVVPPTSLAGVSTPQAPPPPVPPSGGRPMGRPQSDVVPAHADGETMGTVQGVGQTLYDGDLPWLFPFEITSILLLIATVGSVVLAQRRVPAATGETGEI